MCIFLTSRVCAYVYVTDGRFSLVGDVTIRGYSWRQRDSRAGNGSRHVTQSRDCVNNTEDWKRHTTLPNYAITTHRWILHSDVSWYVTFQWRVMLRHVSVTRHAASRFSDVSRCFTLQWRVTLRHVAVSRRAASRFSNVFTLQSRVTSLKHATATQKWYSQCMRTGIEAAKCIIILNKIALSRGYCVAHTTDSIPHTKQRLHCTYSIAFFDACQHWVRGDNGEHAHMVPRGHLNASDV